MANTNPEYTNCTIEKRGAHSFAVVGGGKRLSERKVLFTGSTRKECSDFCKENNAGMAGYMKIYRKPSTLKQRLDMLERLLLNGKIPYITVDCGAPCYRYIRYEFTDGGYRRDGYHDNEISIYVEDFDNQDREMLLVTLSDEDMRIPHGEKDQFHEFYFAKYESDYPSIIEIRNYTYR